MKKDNNKKIEKQKNIAKEEPAQIEDTTKYGEFMSSYFKWITPEEQKEKAKKLAQLGTVPNCPDCPIGDTPEEKVCPQSDKMSQKGTSPKWQEERKCFKWHINLPIGQRRH